MVDELLLSELRVDSVYALPEWIATHAGRLHGIQVQEVKPFELERISTLKTPNQVVAIAQIPRYDEQAPDLCLLLDHIQDPGNLGAMIRIADWYDIRHIFCSPSTVDAFNPKVVQSSMGSIFRIQVSYLPLHDLIRKHADLPVYAATLHGEDIGRYHGLRKGMILIGNESQGVSEELLKLSNHQITIPRKGNAESLNAAVATGIICHALLS